MSRQYKILSSKEFFSDAFFPLSALKFVHNMRNEQAHIHEFSELVIVTSGNATHEVNGLCYKIRQGNVFIVPKGLTHQYINPVKLHLINIIYDPDKLPIPVMDMGDFIFFNLLFHKPSEIKPEDLGVLLHLDKEKIQQVSGMADLIADQRDSWVPGSHFCSLAAFMQIAGLLSQWHHQTQNAKAPIYAAAKILNYINHNYSSHIDMDKLAAVCGMSRRTLFRCFSNATGMTPGSYLLRVRIRHAAEMLRQTATPVSEIALLCGFSDSNYFSKQFRRIMDTTPSAYRGYLL